MHALKLFCLLTMLLPVRVTAKQKASTDTVSRKLVVAMIRTAKGKPYQEVTFLQSARFYKLLRTGRRYNMYLQLLKKSEKTHLPVIIKRSSEYSDTILSVKPVKG